MPLPAFLRPPARPRWGRLAVAAGLGAGVALGQVPFSLWPVAMVALSVLLRMLATGWAGWTAFAAGIGYVAAGMFWITEPFMVEAKVYGWMAPFALILMGAGMGAFWALGAGLGAKLGHTTGRRALGAAVGLAASDALRSYIFTGFPWILFGHIWIGTPVAQGAAWIGAIGLSLCTLLVAALPWLRPGRAVQGVAVGAVAIGLAWWGGSLRLDVKVPPRDPAINLRLVQPNATQALKWDPRYALPFFYRHLDLTAEPPAAGKPRPDLVIWPETAVPFLLDNPGDGLNMIAEAAGGVPVALGIQRSEGERYYNSLVVLGPDARVEDLYDKSHLVPFGEYIPWGDELSRFGISAFAARTGNGYTPGAGETILDLGRLGKVEPLICYEAVFPQDIRRVPERPDWIMQVTNDAWFGNLSGPWQHMALSRLRAIEFGLPVARAANTGVSVMIDARGEVTAELGMNQQGVIDAALPPALPETFYARWGDIPPIAAIVVLAFIILSWPRHYGVDRSFRQV
ncbi:apolipoprotein N-acyltransferase [Paenirhodobacter enshiensis]|uniref:apolipoprotein N-acyltransferase n=1 Tax=Paenirhodobacter enshiensis TaxID=1105367 RepID=UPI0035B154EB